MIALLIPLGLLGLLGLVALIIIYIIRPNYQVKHISSTYVWQLSLRYRKKRIPTNRIRNILIFLCQVLIITLIAGILSMPVVREAGKVQRSESIIIIDSSASMYAGSGADTRFSRAIEKTAQLSNAEFAKNGLVSVILADESPDYLVKRISAADRTKLSGQLDALATDEYACSFATSDLEGAMERCEEVLSENPLAEIKLVTDKSYDYEPEGVEVVSVAQPGEWNAAILEATAELVDNLYTVTVRVACYGKDSKINLHVAVTGANALDKNAAGESRSFDQMVNCAADTPVTVIFRTTPSEEKVENTVNYVFTDQEKFYSYRSIQVSVEEPDNFTADNHYFIYGGQKEVLKLQYASELPNPFFTGALDVLHNAVASNWDLQVTEVHKGDDAATTGFDFYIFEHRMPETMPTDGVVFLVDPYKGVPANCGLRFVSNRDYNRVSTNLTPGEGHPIMENVKADHLTVSRCVELEYDPSYQVLMWCDNIPVLLVKKDGPLQVITMTFSVHYSNLVTCPEFFFLFHNIFSYFFPYAVEKNAFSVGEKIALNSRGPTAQVVGQDEVYEQFPAELSFRVPGTYTIRTGTYFSEEMTNTEIYIKIPEEESNITKREDSLEAPYREQTDEFQYDDLLIYFAAALVALLLLEWWLQWRENR